MQENEKNKDSEDNPTTTDLENHELDIEFLRTTRDNFLIWKDFEND